MVSREGWTKEEKEFSSSAFTAMAQIAADMVMDNENGYMISLIGQTSVGKTLLMKCLRRFWNYHVPPKPYTSRADFHLATWTDWASHKWEAVEDAKSARCLFLDEVGRGRQRDANGLDRLIDLLSYRENRGLWTGLTAQLSHKEFMELDPALGERLRRGRNVCFQAGNSIRPFHRRGGNQ